MNPELEKQITSLAEKVRLLLQQQARLKKENERLQQELAVCQRTTGAQQKQIGELEQRMAILKYAAGELAEADKKAFEKTINSYIRELDKVINLLSQ